LDADERAWCDANKVVAIAPHDDAGEAAARSTAAAGGEPETPARTDVERQIATIWAEALGHSRFGVNQSFFEVGGHSLAAVCVIVRIAEQLGVEFPFERMFTTPTIEALARAVESAPARTSGAASEDETHPPPLRSVERAGAAPLS